MRNRLLQRLWQYVVNLFPWSKRSQLTYVEVGLYLNELRESVDGALFHYSKLEAFAADWLRTHQAAIAAAREWRPTASTRQTYTENLGASGKIQAHTFDGLESFLAAFARVSLLIFPQRKRKGENEEEWAFRRKRGATLRKLLRLTRSSPLANRTLRDSWMHFDERLDRVVREGKATNRQKFTTSSEASAHIEHTPRVVAMDTLTLYLHDQTGKPQRVELSELKTALLAVESALPGANDRALDTLALGVENEELAD